MKKGDLRRQEILKTAEKLFLTRGYEATSVQDILDALELSKGGFYHHFASKMEVLEAVSLSRAQQRYSAFAREMRASTLGAVEKLNRLFMMVNLFEREQQEFVSMVLKVCYRGGDKTLLYSMRRVSMEKLEPLLSEIIAQGMREGAFYTRQPGGVGRLLLLLAHDVNDEVAHILVEGVDQPESVVAVVDALNVYRDTVELILNAPYGSVRLFDVDRVLRVCRAAMREAEPQQEEQA